MPVSKFALIVAGAGLAALTPSLAQAHPGAGLHETVLAQPLGGVRNDYWYDYKSDVNEAENELRKDLRRAKKASDRREAWAEYNQELYDARKDYRKEMVELGYIMRGRGTVIVEDD